MTGRMPGPTSHTFFSQRLRLHYVDWGNPTKPPLVLLHGYTSHARSWDSFARAMAEQYRVYALDQRGHGESAWADDYSSDEFGHIYRVRRRLTLE